ncbi:MAG: hypothetical protein JST76_02980 [Bacteroidetes bacterium]|nr:hypothetical protein [Bacteroidota bacterium]
MNSTIIKGTVRVGLGMAAKKWAGMTGNRKLYIEALAGEYLGRGQRQYGQWLDAKDDLMSAGSRQLKKSNKALMQQVKKVKKSDTVKSLSKMISQSADKLNIPAPLLATLAVVGVVLLLD